MVIIILWFIFSLLVASLGQKKKIGSTAAFFISLLLSPW